MLDPSKKSRKNHTYQKYTQKHILRRKFENIYFLMSLSRILHFFTQNPGQFTIVNEHHIFAKKSSFWGREREIFEKFLQKIYLSTQNFKINRMKVFSSKNLNSKGSYQQKTRF